MAFYNKQLIRPDADRIRETEFPDAFPDRVYIKILMMPGGILLRLQDLRIVILNFQIFYVHHNQFLLRQYLTSNF